MTARLKLIAKSRPQAATLDPLHVTPTRYRTMMMNFSDQSAKPDHAEQLDQDELEAVEPDEEQLSDKEFLQQLRDAVEGVRAGTVPSMTDAMRPPIQDRPWSPRRKRRDPHGKAF